MAVRLVGEWQLADVTSVRAAGGDRRPPSPRFGRDTARSRRHSIVFPTLVGVPFRGLPPR